MEFLTYLCSFGAGLWSVLHHSLHLGAALWSVFYLTVHLELVYGVFNTSLCIWSWFMKCLTPLCAFEAGLWSVLHLSVYFSWFMECLTPLCAFGAELMKCLRQSHEWTEKDVGLMCFCT